MKPEKMLRRWAASLRAFEDALAAEWRECRATGNVESIHRLRVMLRRARVYLRLGSGILGKPKVEAYRTWSSKVSNGVAHVRDCDVAMAWLQTQPESWPVYQWVSARRKRLWQAARRRLPRLRAMPLEDLGGGKHKHAHAKRLAARFARTFDRDRREIQNFRNPIDTADAEHWHQLRRDLRRLRYLRELCLSPRAQAQDALLRELIHLQELLGNAQNCVASLALLPRRHRSPELPALKAKIETARLDWLRQAQQAFSALQNSQTLARVDFAA